MKYRFWSPEKERYYDDDYTCQFPGGAWESHWHHFTTEDSPWSRACPSYGHLILEFDLSDL